MQTGKETQTQILDFYLSSTKRFWAFPQQHNNQAANTAGKAAGSSVGLKTDLVVVDVTVASDDNAFLNPRLRQSALQRLE